MSQMPISQMPIRETKKKEVYEYGTLVAIGVLAIVGFYFLLPDLKKTI